MTNPADSTPGSTAAPRGGMRETSRAHCVLYDDGCPLCTFQMRMITWLDWFHLLRLVPLSDPHAATIAPGLTPEALHEAIHCVTSRGAIHRGARCIRFASARMPLAWPLAIVLWIPGVIWVAERIYQWISRNRHLLSRWFGCEGACTLLPARARPDERPPEFIPPPPRA